MEWRYQIKDSSRLGKLLQWLKEEPFGLAPKEQAEQILCAFLLPLLCRSDTNLNDEQRTAIALDSIQKLEMQAMQIRRLYGIGYDDLPIPGATVVDAANQSASPRKTIPKAIKANEVSQEELAPYFRRHTPPTT